MVWFFLLFLISGFCSILYEIVWLRLAMAQFGVTSALTAIVLSMFMAGLGLGSWGAGRLIRTCDESREGGEGIPALRLYALAELLIGISALLVPYQFWSGRQLLQRLAVSSSWSYCLGSGVCVALTLIPLVRLHGGDNSAGHAGHQEMALRELGAIVQLSLSRQCTRRGGWIYSSSPAD